MPKLILGPLLRWVGGMQATLRVERAAVAADGGLARLELRYEHRLAGGAGAP